MVSGLALVGGQVLTADKAFSVAEAVGVREGTIAAVGTESHVLGVLGHEAERVHLDGATVIPGLHDTHVHLTKLALQSENVRVDGSRSLEQALAALQRAARQRPPGEWLMVFSEDNVWRLADWAEPRPPTRSELDAVAPEHPVFFPLGQDRAVANTRALEEARRRDLDGLADLSSEGLMHSQTLMGALKELALQAAVPRHPELLEAMCRRLSASGVTSVLDAGRVGMFSEDLGLYSALEAGDRLTIRVTVANRVDPAQPVEQVEDFLSSFGPPLGAETRLITIGPLKMILDGEIVDAWQAEDYPGRPGYRGVQKLTEEYVLAVLSLARRFGWGVCVHTMGGAAITLALGCLAQVFAGTTSHKTGTGLSLAHVFFPSQANLRDCLRLGVWLAVQPPLLYCFGDDGVAAWGRPLARTCSPLRTMINAKVPIAGGTDVWPPNPFSGIWEAVQRRTIDGDVLGLDQALTRPEALRLYTSWAAEATGVCGALGSVDVGKRADLAVFEDDPLTCPLDRLRNPSAVLTFLGGRVVHNNGSVALTSAAY